MDVRRTLNTKGMNIHERILTHSIGMPIQGWTTENYVILNFVTQLLCKVNWFDRIWYYYYSLFPKTLLSCQGESRAIDSQVKIPKRGEIKGNLTENIKGALKTDRKKSCSGAPLIVNAPKSTLTYIDKRSTNPIFQVRLCQKYAACCWSYCKPDFEYP